MKLWRCRTCSIVIARDEPAPQCPCCHAVGRKGRDDAGNVRTISPFAPVAAATPAAKPKTTKASTPKRGWS